jgi:hypothetical protein
MKNASSPAFVQLDISRYSIGAARAVYTVFKSYVSLVDSSSQRKQITTKGGRNIVVALFSKHQRRCCEIRELPRRKPKPPKTVRLVAR